MICIFYVILLMKVNNSSLLLNHRALTLKNVLPQERLGEFEVRTEGYFLTDVSGTYIIHSSNIIHKIIFQIDNIFDQEFYNHLSRIKLIMPEKGRSIGSQYRVVF